MATVSLRGIYAMLVTPFDSREEIDYGALRAEVDWCADQGAQGVVATPSIGEFACLTNEERWKCFEVVSQQCDKHPGLQKIATVAGTHTREVSQHCKVALELGYHAAQLIPPYYWVPDEDEVYRHFQLAAETGLPIVVYHNPRLSKFHMSREFIGRLCEIPGLIALKEVLTDRHVQLEPLYQIVDNRLSIFHTFRVFTTGLTLGSAGGFINVFALPATIKMWQLFNEKREPQRMELIQNKINEVFMRGGEDNKRHIGTTKMCSSLVTGIDMGTPRSPYLLPPDSALERLKQKLPELQALCDI
ncbi:MAG: dihydrodipicolinate synthase family protein [Bdellovibrionales bacterium]|nr:dihydrodipicolinate synthase family protein [Bdellovibrionales bacterium]